MGCADGSHAAIQLHLLGSESRLPLLQLRLAFGVLGHFLDRIAAGHDTYRLVRLGMRQARIYVNVSTFDASNRHRRGRDNAGVVVCIAANSAVRVGSRE